jgi:hypothetical protein
MSHHCGCTPKIHAVANEGSGEVPVARFFMSEEAYERDEGFSTSADTIRKYMSGGSFQKYLHNATQESWIYVKKNTKASNKVVTDDDWWKVTEENVPCISSSHRKLPKKNCGENYIDHKGMGKSTFRWNNAWLFVIDLERCQQYDMQLYEIVKTICSPTFGYHCISKNGGVRPSYVTKQFNEASHIMLMISDCGDMPNRNANQHPSNASIFESIKTTFKLMASFAIPQNSCKFMVLGFAFLITGVKPPKPYPTLLCNAMYYGLRTTTQRSVYVDIICSRFSVAQYMLEELLQKQSQNQIADLLFGKKGSGFACFLRAVPSVYTYYALMFGFTRTADNRSVYPIFFVDVDDIRANIGALNFAQPLADNATNEEIMASIFGPHETSSDIVWKAPPGCSMYRVYRLEPPFKDFLKKNDMLTNNIKRSTYFRNLQVFYGDNDNNGYMFSKFVAKS